MENWLNEQNWLNKPSSEEGVIFKKKTFEALSLFSSPFKTTFESVEQKEKFNSLCDDIDCCSYLLSRYLFQHEELHKLPNVQKHFQSLKNVQYFIENGVIDRLRKILFTEYPQMSSNKKLAFKALSSDSNYVKYFSPLLTDYVFVKKCLNNDILSYEFITYHPHDQFITEQLLMHNYYPNDKNIHLYNQDILSNKAFILPILLNSHGHFLYKYLSDTLRFDIDLCDQVKAAHPHMVVEASSINTLEKFIATLANKSPFSTEIYTVLQNMQKSDFIMNDSSAIAEVFKEMGKHDCECYVDLMAGSTFFSHPAQDFLLEVSKKHKDIAAFLKSIYGKEIISYSIKNYNEFSSFEIDIFPHIGKQLSVFLQASSLDKELSKKKIISHKKKV